jgi:hypothetical protein
MGQLSPKTCWLASYFPPRKRHLLCVCLSPTTVHRNLSFFYFFLPEIPPFTPPICSRWAEKEDEKNNWEELEANQVGSSTHFMTAIRQCRQTLSASFFLNGTHTYTQHRDDSIVIRNLFENELEDTKKGKATTSQTRATRPSHNLSPCHSWPLDGSLCFLIIISLLIFPIFFSRFRLSLPGVKISFNKKNIKYTRNWNFREFYYHNSQTGGGKIHTDTRTPQSDLRAKRLALVCGNG